jgi:hypothetical protein
VLRPLLHFLWIGTLLFAADRWLATDPAPEPVTIAAARVEELSALFLAHSGRPPDAAELEGMLLAEVNDELLYREARRLGFDRDDPVVQQRLIRNMQFARANMQFARAETGAGAAPGGGATSGAGGGETPDAAALYAEALELGMDRSDLVVRRRLIQRMRFAIEARALAEPPTDAELREHYAKNLASYRDAARVRLVQLYFDGDPPGEAAAALVRLREAGTGPEAAGAAGDAFLLGSEQPSQSQRELAERFGATFAEAAFAAPAGAWSGPLASSYGEHLVWVREHTPELQRAFDEVRDSVQYAVVAERRRRELDAALRALREGVQVVVGSG